MASSYTDLLRLTLPATGELAGQWGNTVNTGITELTEAAIAGTAAVTLADANHTLTVANGVTDQARRMFVTLTGTLTAQREVVCPSSSKLYFVSNNTTGGFGVLFKMATGTGIVVPAGKGMVLYCNGTNVVDAVSHMSSLTVTNDAVVNGITAGLGGGSVTSNTVFGKTALSANTSGAGNTALGSLALTSNTTGFGNVAVGGTALRTTVDGTYNTAVGVDALRLNASGSYNVAVGPEAAYNTTAGSNLAIGYQALRANTTGANNIAIGVQAGSQLTTGSNNTLIGNLQGTAGMEGTILIGAGGTERIRVTSAGNTLLGTTTDDGVNKLQVNGSVSATGMTLTGGTANGVSYLNASKVLTTGSVLTFDGSKFLSVAQTNGPWAWDAAYTGVITGRTSLANATGLSVTITHLASSLFFDGTNWKHASTTNSNGSALTQANGGLTFVGTSIQGSSGNLAIAPTLFGVSNAGVAYVKDTIQLDGGTANGVPYLNASKVLTSGTALTFNGTTLATTGALTVDGNATLGNASTDTVTVNGYMGVGATPAANIGIRVARTLTGNSQEWGVYADPTFDSSATSIGGSVGSKPATAAASFTVSNIFGFRALDATKGAGSTITNLHGLYIDDQTQGTNNFGITSLVSSGSNKWNIYASGTANNAFAGNVRIGSTTAPTNALDVTGNANITGNTTLGDATTDTVTVNGYMGVGGAPLNYVGLRVTGSVLGNADQYGISSSVASSSGATSSFSAAVLTPATAAATFTSTNVSGALVQDANKGAGSTITNLHGIRIADQTQGTNNYGITSLVSSGTNKWNIYASGTAANYFAGNVGIGTTSPEYKLQVSGTTGQTFSIERVASAIGSSTALGTIAGTGEIPTLTADGASIQFLGAGTWSATSSPGRIVFNTTPAATTTPVERFQLAAGEAVFNDPGNDYDFRVESDTNTHALFVQGSDGNVGIGTSSPLAKLHSNPGVTVNTVAALFTSGNSDPGFRAGFANGSGSGTDTEQAKIGMWYGTTQAPVCHIGLLRGGSANSNGLTFSVNNTERLRIDSAGNLGLGVVPSAWRTAVNTKAFQIGDGAALYAQGTSGSYYTTLTSNAFQNTSNQNAYINTGFASSYTQVSGQHIWLTAPSGTAGNAITFTQAMTLDASGNLGIGTTATSGGRLNITAATQAIGAGVTNGLFLLREFGGSAANNTLELNIRPDSGKSGYLTFTESGVADRWSVGIANGGGNLRFISGTPTSGTERMRLGANGFLGLGTSSPQDLVHANSGGTYARIKLTNATTGAGTSDGLDILVNGLDASIIQREAAALTFATSAIERMRLDSIGNLIQTVNTTAATLATNGTMTFSIVDNSTLRISVRGSDGTTRTATVALT